MKLSKSCMLQEAGAQAVAAAMMATLPGIDANDPRKTLACFRLYCVVLSSVGIQVCLSRTALLLALYCFTSSLHPRPRYAHPVRCCPA